MSHAMINGVEVGEGGEAAMKANAWPNPTRGRDSKRDMPMNEIDLKGGNASPRGPRPRDHNEKVGCVAVLNVGWVFCGKMQCGIEQGVPDADVGFLGRMWGSRGETRVVDDNIKVK